MRHSMSPRSSGHKRGPSLQSRQISCKCVYLECESTRAVVDLTAHCRYAARLPRFLLLFLWSEFRCHNIPPENVLLELRTFGEQPTEFVQQREASVLVAERLFGPVARLSSFAWIPGIAEADSAVLGPPGSGQEQAQH